MKTGSSFLEVALQGSKVCVKICYGEAMVRFVGLLRGINVGGHKRLKMTRLIELFSLAGAAEISTYIQSGNVLFSSGSVGEARTVLSRVERRLEDEDGIVSPIVLRTEGALREALEGHPFIGEEADERMLSVGFLSDKPKKELVKLLQPHRSPGDRFVVSGSDIYLHTPNGIAKSKLSVSYFDSTLGVVTTVRNLKTLRAIVALLG